MMKQSSISAITFLGCVVVLAACSSTILDTLVSPASAEAVTSSLEEMFSLFNYDLFSVSYTVSLSQLPLLSFELA